MKSTVVLFPGLGTSHLNPVVELGKQIVTRGYDVTIVLTSDSSRVAAANPTVTFHTLPPPNPFPDLAGLPPVLQMMEILRSHNANLVALLKTIPSLAGVVLHFFCFNAFEAVKELGVPTYFFYTSGAVDLAVFTHLGFVDDANTSPPFKNLGGKPITWYPFLPPVTLSHLPKECLDENSSKFTYKLFTGMLQGRGILTNTFEALEPGAAAALRDPAFLPGQKMPPVYHVGPLVGAAAGSAGEKHECLTWLDAQPARSVVFICFGSMAAPSAKDLLAIAGGLESSGLRFLWAVRTPKPDDPSKFFEQMPPPDLNVLLPEGFLERTAGRGMVLTGWAPQMEILRHPSTGAFLSHVGWNSTMEGLTSGLPLICWPQYAEQRMNMLIVADLLHVGVELKGFDTGDVTADEVAAKLKLVMEADEGREIRKRVLDAKDAAEAALKEGGSSAAAIDALLLDMKNAKLAA